MRIDMSSRQWHELVKPVLPHTLKSPDFPELGHVRIEAGARTLYAVATDRYTLGAERHPLGVNDRNDPQPPVHVRAADLAASLKLFPFTKDDDPQLSLTIDTAYIPATVMGENGSYTSMAVTLQSADGGRLVMHDRRMAARDPLAAWRHAVAAVMRRAPGALLDGLDLASAYLTRWKEAVRAGERLTLRTGPQPRDPLLITVEDHFAGLWVPQLWGDERAADPASLPWLAELDDASSRIQPATGVHGNRFNADAGTGEITEPPEDDDGEED